ncbi:hypothetical protein K7X08_008280 [Anisodus acutangulus]|uniref:Uncharacterized protein n=1 Tax=Anisodus acutangulus TaxID=402998 RepID=A0A9Q1MVW2_9SOLA|nr:hypothetical protein K7X08_008280 [Anisodus acutangulus]
MLTLNLLPSTNATLPNPNFVNRNPKLRGLCLPILPFTKPSIQNGHPFRCSANLDSQISHSRLDFSNILRHPSGFSSRITTQILKAASGTPDEVSPDGEIIEASKPKVNMKLALIFGLWYFQNIVFNIYNKKNVI